MRLSNMELLRIISMLMVLVLHIHSLILGEPNRNEIVANPMISISRVFTYYLTIIAVDVFVLISGWFGIHLKIKRIAELYFQICFFVLVFLLFAFVSGQSGSVSIGGILGMLVMGNSEYWFLKPYIMLCFMAPLLNSYIEQASEKQFRMTLILGFSFLIIYGWIFPESTDWIQHGYSLPCFIYLYILARYLRLYPNKVTTMNMKVDFMIYLSLVLINTVVGILLIYFGIDIKGRNHFYFSPFIILTAVYLLLAFSKMEFHNKVINWIGSSCLAVFLFHSNQFFFNSYYRKPINTWFTHESFLVYFVYTSLLILSIYIISILLDKVRLYIWGNIVKE